MIKQVIANREEFDSFKEEIQDKSVFAFFLPSDMRLHPVANRLSAVFFFTEESYWVMGINHVDLPALDTNWLDELSCVQELIVLSKKDVFPWVRGDHVVDSLHYLTQNGINTSSVMPLRYGGELQGVLSVARERKNSNDILPVVKHLEQIKKVYDKVRGVSKIDSFIQQCSSDVYARIEASGLQIDHDLFRKYNGEKSLWYTKNSRAYPKYNLYTRTGRPSCSFGGVNYAALNKTDGSRSFVLSRFPNGRLVQFDFDSFHLRLIGAQLPHKFTDTSVHMQLAKEYYPTVKVTDEVYESSKKTTFSHLYSDREYEGNNDFLRKVSAFKNDLKDMYYRGDYPSDVKVDPTMSKSKMMNYYIQNLEYKVVTRALERVLDITENLNSCVILSTYDSILMDFSPEEGVDLLREVKDTLESPADVPELKTSVRFPVKVEAGKHYNNMKKVSLAKKGG